VGADWAFAEGSDVGAWNYSERGLAAFVMRGDRQEPSQEWLDWARDLLSALGLSPVVVVQVESDAKRAHSLAAALGGRVLEWPEGVSHDEQEAAVRAVYRECRIVVGDRLHGLIVAATEGAVPLGWVESSRGKIAEHFDPVGLEFVGQQEGDRGPELTAIDEAQLGVWRTTVAEAVAAARAHLALTREQIATTVAGPR